MPDKKNKIKKWTGAGATALVAFYLLMPVSVNAFCLIAEGTSCGPDCEEAEECGFFEDSATGRCEMTVDAETETSGLFCRDAADLVEDAAVAEAAAEATDQAIAERREREARIASKDAIPVLAVNIPSVQFSDIRKTKTDDGMYYIIEIPWMADYIIGVYRYSVFIGSILSIVMIMIGGLQWMTAGGDASRISNAKNRINNAVVGLVLILGSFLVLNTINPELTLLNPLKVKVVNEERYNVREVLQTTTEDTGNPLEL